MNEPTAKSSFGGQIRIVLRNTKTDRLYILEVNAHREEQGYWYSVTAFWGAWSTYQRSGFAELRHWNRYSGRDRAAVTHTVRDIMQDKLTRFGYRVVEERSILPKWPILHYGQNWRVYKYHEEESHHGDGDNLPVQQGNPTDTGSAGNSATVRQLQMW